MVSETAQEKRVRRQANYHFAAHARPLPEGCTPVLTSTYLKRHGFERIARGYYRRDFSGALELRFLMSGKKGVYYDWIMNTTTFAQMNKELRAFKKRINGEARRLRKIMRAEAKRVLGNKEPRGEFPNQLMSAAKAVKTDAAAFTARYEEFLGIVDEAHAVGPYYRARSFSFDACTTTHELDLFTEFVALYLQVFRNLKVARSRKALSAGEVKEAITAYYVYYAAIKKIRDLWASGRKVQSWDLEKRFPTIDPEMLQDITLDADTRYGWEYRARELALDLASNHCNTTAGSLRQMLYADKTYAGHVREQVAGVKDIEKVLNHSARVPSLWPFGPKRQQDEQASAIIRSVLTPPLPM